MRIRPFTRYAVSFPSPLGAFHRPLREAHPGLLRSAGRVYSHRSPTEEPELGKIFRQGDALLAPSEGILCQPSRSQDRYANAYCSCQLRGLSQQFPACRASCHNPPSSDRIRVRDDYHE